MEMIFYIIGAIIVVLILGFIYLRFAEKPVNRANEFVLRNLKKIVSGKDDDSKFDDFISVPIANKRFEEIRKYCCDVNVKGVFSNYSEDEKKMINEFISEIESSN